ncbi:outer membrane beta-barrel protein [Phaeodactylibacter luteus]|uniref:Outer membrane beta-barrel protein n=2 Tax=Phaeodactylibacter luteus TaxID=1564516 RepID=A0A5C6RNS2_9BACT|nr:outer membrane beta-barrel protein [Phaeodactylibacter luteus]
MGKTPPFALSNLNWQHQCKSKNMNTKTLLLLALALLSSLALGAQSYQVFGRVADGKTEQPLPGAHIYLSGNGNEYTALTSERGGFRIAGLPEGAYQLQVSFVGYATLNREVAIAGQDLRLGLLALQEIALDLDEIEITGKVPLATQQGDTTQYSSAAYKVNPDANAEDLIRKMPGVVLENGQVQAQGEQVQQVLVDGKPFFGNDPAAALRNLPAEVIDKIQVFDQQSDQDRFSGFNSGETTKAINIITKPGMRQGEFGKLYAGIGPDAKYQAGGALNIFKGDSRISLIGQTNNINQQNFASEDLTGLLGNSGGRSARGGRGGGRPGRGSSGGNASDFLIGAQNGIATTHAFGLNYTDKWGEKTEVTASYFLNYTDNEAAVNEYRAYLNEEIEGQVFRQQQSANNQNLNHRFNLRAEHNFNDRNALIIQPRLTLQESQGMERAIAQTTFGDSLLNLTNYGLRADLSATDFSNRLTYRHRFEKRGRTLSLSTDAGYKRQNGDRFLDSESQFFEDTLYTEQLQQYAGLDSKTWQYGADVRYSEPLGEKAQLQLSLASGLERNDGQQETFDYLASDAAYSLLNPALSNTFNSNYRTHSGGAGLRINNKGLMFNLQLTAQWANLEGEQVFPNAGQVGQQFFNILPRAFLRYRFSQSANLRAGYFTRTSPPGLSQLQEAVNNSNPVQLTTGNAELEQDYSHRLFARYSNTNTEKGTVFFALLSAQYTANHIGNSTLTAARDTDLGNGIILPRGAQLIQPVNLNGYWNARAYTTYGFPLSPLRSNLNTDLSLSYIRSPGLVNGAANFANTLTSGLGLTLSSNISEQVDFTIGSRTSMSQVRNTLNSALDNSFINQSSRVGANFIFGKGWVIRTDLNHQLYSGLSDGFNQNFWLLNAALGKKFLKDDRAELTLSAFDLLGQNNSISREVTDAYLQDTQTQVLRRFFMLTFTYNIRHFGSPQG